MEARQPCEPYCSFLDAPEPEDEVPICNECGACWMVREVVEVDPETLLTTAARGWTRL